MRKQGFVLSLLFCLSCAPPLVAQAVSARLSQVADGRDSGGAFKTSFVLLDHNELSVDVRIVVTDDGGNPLRVTIPGLGIGCEFNVTLGPWATRILPDPELWSVA